jgi:hypothetical protein
VGFNGLKICHALMMTLVSFLVTTLCSCFSNWIRLVVDIRIFGAPFLFCQELPPHLKWPRHRKSRCPCPLSWGGRKSFEWQPTGGMFKAGDILFCTADFFEVRRFHQCRPASAFILLGNHPPTLFVALWLLMNWAARMFTLSTSFSSCKAQVYKCHTGL